MAVTILYKVTPVFKCFNLKSKTGGPSQNLNSYIGDVFAGMYRSGPLGSFNRLII